MRVLVVEDEVLMAEAIAEGLRRHSMAVDISLDGAHALELLAEHSYDVVVLDRDLVSATGSVRDRCAERVTGRSRPG